MTVRLILTLIIFAISFAQQAWTQKSGKGYIQFGTSIFSYNTAFGDNGKKVDLPWQINETILSAYAEYGLTDELMLSLNFPYHLGSTGKINKDYNGVDIIGNKLNGLGNISTALTYNLSQHEGWVISSKIEYKFNTSVRERIAGLQTGFNSAQFMPSMLVGFGTSDYFTSAELGINFFNKGFSDRFIFNAQIGKEFLSDGSLIGILGLNFNHIISDFPESKIFENDEIYQYSALYRGQQSYRAWNLKLGYKFLPDFFLWASMAGGTGKNLGHAAVFSFALATQF